MSQPDDSPRQRGMLYRSFIGPGGLRAGWRLLIFVVLFVFFLVATGIATAMLLPSLRSHGESSALLIITTGLGFVSVLLATGVMAAFERRKFSTYGLPWQRMFRSQFWLGAALGFVSLSLLVLMLWASGGLRFEGVALHGREIWSYAGSCAVLFLFVALAEECLIFGYSLFTLFTGMGFWPAAVLASSVFGALHLGNAGESWLGVANAGLAGMLSCILLRRTGNLWMGIGCHAAWDWAETYFFGVANSGNVIEGHLLNSSAAGPAWLSGGSVGPEGSVLCTVLWAAECLVICLVLREARFPAAGRDSESPDAAESERTVDATVQDS